MAILAADAAGYSRLMAADESMTVAALDAARAVFRTQIEANQGRVIDMAGDSVLAVFETAAGATLAALKIQRQLEAACGSVAEQYRMRFRIGVHLGDVIEKADGSVYGDGVNIAARLQGLATPGGITISDVVRGAVRGKVRADFQDQGERAVKNIDGPVRAFRVMPDLAYETKPTPDVVRNTPSIHDKPSIAVLPFQNMSGEPEQEYFADGMVEEIITALSRMRSLFVIARNSSFVYKGRAVDVKQVGRDLGVRYVLEGSVRKAGNRVRITGQLVDAETGAHIWADRFEGELEDIFDLQDQITTSVVGAIAPKVEQAEIYRAKHKRTESLDAYDYLLRGLASFYRSGNREAIAEALGLFERAIELDPEYASAYAMAAMCYAPRKANGWMTDPQSERAEAERLARRSVVLGKDDAFVLVTSGWVLAYVVQDLDAGATFVDRAMTLNPNLANCYWWGAWIKIWLGEPEEAIARVKRAMRLSPLEPSKAVIQNPSAHAHFFADRFDEASLQAAIVLQDNPNFQTALRIHAASSALAGRLSDAQKSVARLRELNPTLRVSNLKDVLGPYRRAEDIAKYQEGLRQAGLPE